MRTKAPPTPDYDPVFFDRAARLTRPLTRLWFRSSLHGVERLPAGPCLLVGNHSALGTAELLCLLAEWHAAFGTDRPVVGLMHDFFIASPGIGHFYRKIGAVNASAENARRALAAGCDVIVFPGGDIDSCRPFYEPRAVHFGDRRGYAKLALDTGVPVVPLATIGSHHTWHMGVGGRALARALRLDRLLRAECVPLPLGVGLALAGAVGMATGALGLGIGAAMIACGLVPNPVRITSALGAAIDPTEIAVDAPREARVEAVHQAVYGALWRAVATMQHDDPLAEARPRIELPIAG